MIRLRQNPLHVLRQNCEVDDAAKWNQNFDGEPMTDIPQKFLNAGCDVYMVMQLRHDEKIFDERFASMRELNRRGKTPDPEHYEVTYYADLPAMWQDVPNDEVLEELFPGVQPLPSAGF